MINADGEPCSDDPQCRALRDTLFNLLPPAFVNQSPFSGVVEYTDQYGNWFRRMDEGTTWAFYRLQNNAFIREGSMSKRGHRKKTIEQVHKDWCSLDDAMEDDF